MDKARRFNVFYRDKRHLMVWVDWPWSPKCTITNPDYNDIESERQTHLIYYVKELLNLEANIEPRDGASYNFIEFKHKKDFDEFLCWYDLTCG